MESAAGFRSRPAWIVTRFVIASGLVFINCHTSVLAIKACGIAGRGPEHDEGRQSGFERIIQ